MSVQAQQHGHSVYHMQDVHVQALNGANSIEGQSTPRLQQLLAVQKFGVGLSSQMQGDKLLCTGKPFSFVLQHASCSALD